MIRTVAVALLASAAFPAFAQVPAGNSAPQPVPLPDPIPAPRDVPFPGTLKLDVDASNTEQGIIHVRETIPVQSAGDTILLFPKWLPGNHAPSGQLAKVAGLTIRAGGKDIGWTRDPVNLYAFHVNVPAGVKSIEASFQFLSATKPDQGGSFMGNDVMRLQWISTSLYPAGYFTRQIPVAATVTYPAGFIAVSSVPSTKSGATYRYQTTNYEILMDSPVVAGRYYKAWELSPKVTLDTFADTPDELAATPEQIDAHKRLVSQAIKLFGAEHYDHYNFLFSISSQIGGSGLEHHRSSEDGTKLGYFTDWSNTIGARNLLPHEYTHSWDGKFRRAADLWTPNFDVPMRPGLLWVYEGGTQFFGYVLQARAGLVSKQDTLDQYAAIMAGLDNTVGRQWRDLTDTTYDEAINARNAKGWATWQRGEDYYNEGLLIWMEVDSLLREKSGGTKSIDDFARAFFGMRDGDYGELTYTIDDVAATLNGVVPYDWKGYLVRRTTEHAAGAPIAGFERNGYKLVYTDQPTTIYKQAEKGRKVADFTYSGGFAVGAEGALSSVTWNGAAFKAGLDTGMSIVSIGDLAYSDDRMKAAIVAAKGGKAPIRLTVKSGDRYLNVDLNWHGGLRYPHLQKIGTGEGGLDRLLAAKP